MVNVATDIAWTRDDTPWPRLTRRLRALARQVRIQRSRRRALRHIFAGSLDPRMLEDVGIDPYRAPHYQWLRELVRAMDRRF